MKRLCILASSNNNKLKELKEIFHGRNFLLQTAAELGDMLDVEETEESFEGNAMLKVKAYQKLYPDAFILADDSGLCIDALDGLPGVYSARFAGVESDYQVKSQAIWDMLNTKGIPKEKWDAKFVCAIAFYNPENQEIQVFEGEMNGRIIEERRGEHGFGYDPIFFLDEYQKTSAEIDPHLKNQISHRARALQALEAFLDQENL